MRCREGKKRKGKATRNRGPELRNSNRERHKRIQSEQKRETEQRRREPGGREGTARTIRKKERGEGESKNEKGPNRWRQKLTEK